MDPQKITHSDASGAKTISDTAKTVSGDSKTLSDGLSASDVARGLTVPHIPDHELLTRIGRGSYGEVWLARNVMGTYRAVKIVYRATFEHARPFEREFKGIQKFEPISRSHDGLVDILQVGRTETCFYYVMELADDQVTGQHINPDLYNAKTLRSELTQRGKLPSEECLNLALSLTASLGQMHQKGLIHRDIKPSNIIFVNGQPKLADIGLVAEQNEAKSFVGTEGFIPPEGPGTPQADIYSLGKVLYEICTGKDRHEFPALPTLLGDETEDETLVELNAVFLEACQSDLKQRYHSAEQMRDDLLLLQSGKSVKRAQAVEKRLALLARVSVLGSVTFVLILAAFFFYRRAYLRAEHAERETRQQLYVSDMVLAEKALSNGSVQQAEEVLESHRPKPGSPDLRGFEYYYLRQLCPGDQLFTFPPEEREVFAVAYSPDSKILATGSTYVEEQDYSGQLRLIDLTTRTEIANLPIADGTRCLAFSPDGKLLASGSAGSVAALWDTVTHQKTASIFGGGGAARKVAFSRDGKLLAALFSQARSPNAPGRIVFWDTVARNETHVLKLVERHFGSFAFSPDGRSLVLADWGQIVRTYDLESKLVVAQKHLTVDSKVLCLECSPDSKTVALGFESGLVVLWQTDQGQIVKLGAHEKRVLTMAFSPDGRDLVTGSDDGTIKLWRMGENKGVRLLMGHRSAVRQVIFSPNGTQLASASTDHTVRLWSVTRTEANVFRGHTDRVTALDFSPDGKLLATASADRTVKIWNLGTGIIQENLADLTNAARCVAFSPAGNYLAAGGLDGTKVWRVPLGQAVTNLARLSPTSSAETRIAVTPLEEGAKFSPDGKFLFVGETSFTRIWEAGSWRLVTNLLGSGAVACSLDSRVLANIGSREVRLWDVGGWRQVNALESLRARVTALVFTPDGHTLVTGGRDCAVSFWDVANGRQQHLPLKGQVVGVTALAISPDGKTLAIGELSGAIKLWNIATRREMFTLVGHAEMVSCLAFSPDGTTLASGSSDFTVRLWRAAGSEKSNLAQETQR